MLRRRPSESAGPPAAAPASEPPVRLALEASPAADSPEIGSPPRVFRSRPLATPSAPKKSRHAKLLDTDAHAVRSRKLDFTEL